MSKLIIEIPPISDEDCYYVQERNKPSFNYPLHKHNAYELNFVEHCEGARRIVGDSVEVLGEYDLAFIGCNLEHVWEQYECKSAEIHEITIQMPDDLFSDKWLNKRVMSDIRKMFEDAKVGIAFGMKSIMKVYERLNSLVNAKSDFSTVQMMLSVLNDLATSNDYHCLSSSRYSHVDVPVASRRIHKIKEYIDNNFENDIRIETLAELINMTPNALSRFFKQRTNRTITNYINDVRIGKASLMLVESSKTILEICYSCGFNTISNFNRAFKNIKGITPTEFRETYKKNAYIL